MLRMREAQAKDEAVWRHLWAGYIAFYGAVVAEEVTAATWARILDPASPIFCTLAEQDGEVAGFAACVVHVGTWSLQSVCYLEDFFVVPDYRGAGIGRAVINDLRERAAAAGWSQLHWHTRHDNPARKLYDEFVPAEDFVWYRLNIS